MNKKIFVVEDDALTAAQLKQYIEEMGYQFAGKADSGEAALAGITQSKPDLVLMDIRLRGTMNGVETAAQLTASAPVALIYLTAFVDEDILARAKLTEPLGYLVKPFSKDGLKASIEVALHKSEVARKEQRIHEAMIRTITGIVRLHDPYLDNEQTIAAQLAQDIAVDQGLPAAEVRAIRLAAMLHSIGLVGIPSALTCYGTSLHGPEKALFETHPEIAWNLLKDLEFPDSVAEMVHQHMERLDGSGYPRHLAGTAILPGACIVAVACAASSMLCVRGMQAPPRVEEVVAALERDRSAQLDDNAVTACVRLLQQKSYAMTEA